MIKNEEEMMSRTIKEIQREISEKEARLSELRTKAAAWGNMQNEGAEGYQDYDVRYEIPELETALRALRDEEALVELVPSTAAFAELRDKWNAEIKAQGTTQVAHETVRGIEAKLGVTMAQLGAAKKYYNIK
jgi:hypothetical protein